MEKAMESEFSPEFQARALKVLHSIDDKPMETMLYDFCSDQEPQRSEAQRLIECCKKLDPFTLVQQLSVLIRCSLHVETRARAARVLRFVRVPDLWPKLDETTKHVLKPHLLALLSEKNAMSVLKVVCVVISETVSEMYKGGQPWPELLNFLLDCLGKNDERFQITSLLVFAKLPRHCRWLISEDLSPHVENIHYLLLKALVSANPNVQVASFGVVVSLLSLFSQSSNRSVFDEILKAMMVGIYSLLDNHQYNHAKKAIKELTKLVSEDPHFLKPYGNDIVLNMVKIVVSPAFFEDEIRCLSSNLVITMKELEDFKTIFLNLPHDALDGLISRAIMMLDNIKEDEVWCELEGEGDTDSSTEKINLYKFAFSCLYRLSNILDGSEIVRVVPRFFSVYLKSEKWMGRYAGIKMLTATTKELSDDTILIEDFLQKVAAYIFKFFRDSHFQVRLATFKFMQMHTNFIQAMHTLYHDRLLTEFGIALCDQNEKVKKEAISAILLFQKNTLPKSLTRCTDVAADAVMTKFRDLFPFKTDKQILFALSTFNAVAQQCREVAIRNYVKFLSFLLEACNEKSSEVKEVAVRGIRICAEFGTPEFQPYLSRTILELKFLIQLPNLSPLPENIKVHDVAVSALGRICEFHRDGINASKLVPEWLGNLPLEDDLSEARIMHEQLCLMVARSDMELLGPGNRNLGKIVEVFLEVIDNGEKLATVETLKRMGDLLRRIWREFPRTTSDAIYSSLNVRQRELLSAVLYIVLW